MPSKFIHRKLQRECAHTYSAHHRGQFDPSDSPGSVSFIVCRAQKRATQAQKGEMQHDPSTQLTVPAGLPNPAETTTSSTPDPAKFSDSRVLSLLRDFLRAEKPDWMGPAEVAYIADLFTHKTIDHEGFPSQEDRAAHIGTSVKSIRRIEQRLEQRGLISATRSRGNPNRVSLSLDKLPVADRALPRKPSEEANALVQWYLGELIRRGFHGPHRKQLKNVGWNAEKILRKSDPTTARAVLAYVISTRPNLRSSLYHIAGQWKRLRAEYERANAVTVSDRRTIRETQAEIDSLLVEA